MLPSAPEGLGGPTARRRVRRAESMPAGRACRGPRLLAPGGNGIGGPRPGGHRDAWRGMGDGSLGVGAAPEPSG
jgi:hypothetical protein